MISDILNYDEDEMKCYRTTSTQKNWYLPSVWASATAKYTDTELLDDAIITGEFAILRSEEPVTEPAET